jgi:Uncharacterized protein conserved in bacteria
MKFEWDEDKNETNIRDRGIDFADAREMFENPMLIKADDRKDYGETRYIDLSHIQGRLMVVVFTEREPDIIRIISLRKVNKREQARFEKAIADRLGAHRRDEGRGY